MLYVRHDYRDGFRVQQLVEQIAPIAGLSAGNGHRRPAGYFGKRRRVRGRLNRLLEPSHVQFRQFLRYHRRGVALEAAVAVHENRGVLSRRVSNRLHPRQAGRGVVQYAAGGRRRAGLVERSAFERSETVPRGALRRAGEVGGRSVGGEQAAVYVGVQIHAVARRRSEKAPQTVAVPRRAQLRRRRSQPADRRCRRNVRPQLRPAHSQQRLDPRLVRRVFRRQQRRQPGQRVRRPPRFAAERYLNDRRIPLAVREYGERPRRVRRRRGGREFV